MGFTGGNSSPDTVKKKKKKKNSFDQRDCEYPRVKPTGAGNDSVRQHIKKMDPICKTMKKSCISHQLSVDEDVDLEQLDTDRCLDDRDCMRLSSDCSSPTSFFEEHRLSSPFHLVADDCLISRLSTLADSYLRLDKGSTTFNNGSCSDYMKETSLTPETTSPDTEKRSGATLPLNSPGNAAVDSSVTSPGSAKSSCGKRFEDFQSCDKSLTPTRIDFDSCYQISSDTEGKGYLNLDEDSLMNLDGEDSRWISDTDSEWDNFSFGFHSPSYRSSCGSEAKSSNFSASPAFEVEHGKLQHVLSSELASEATNLEDSNEHEPLFWPFDHKHDWSSEEAWKCFSMSPRKDLMIVKTPERTSLRSIGSQLHKPGSAASKILELKQRNNNKGVKKINPVPSRMRNSKKSSMNVVPLEMKDDVIETKDGKISSRSFPKEDFALNKQHPMEIFLGLREFDGYEGGLQALRFCAIDSSLVVHS
ncbi:hypothetical protein LWI28_010638 [Acer negundo]|uniref:Uncharacterized protein n=1 Tax=Acer negundo TaxID=4023 RepID=A0AAD5JDJ1_ACENE|nr:hypothetical protein LWI28_010638 [Acer negundo]